MWLIHIFFFHFLVSPFYCVIFAYFFFVIFLKFLGIIGNLLLVTKKRDKLCNELLLLMWVSFLLSGGYNDLIVSWSFPFLAENIDVSSKKKTGGKFHVFEGRGKFSWACFCLVNKPVENIKFSHWLKKWNFIEIQNLSKE